MKRISCLVLALVLIIMSSVYPCYGKTDLDKIPLSSKNEWDFVEELEFASSEDLIRMNISKSDAERYVKEAYDALYKRASMSEEELLEMGYTSFQIDILKKYANGSKLTRSEIRAITATYYDYISVSNVTSRTATIDYNWYWDQAPVVTQKDSVGVIWRAVNSNGTYMDINRTARYAGLTYYKGSNYMFFTSSVQFENVGFDGANAQFQLGYEDNGAVVYAKYGYVTISLALDSSVLDDFAYVRFYGQYGHTVIGIGYPSISLSFPFSISFSGNTYIDTLGGREIRVYPNGSWDYV